MYPFQEQIQNNPLDPKLEENLRTAKEDKTRKEGQLATKEHDKQELGMSILTS